MAYRAGISAKEEGGRLLREEGLALGVSDDLGYHFFFFINKY